MNASSAAGIADLPTLVEASAGTGKTHAITTCFVTAILERDLGPDQILVVTYTKAATAELRARARRRVTEAIAVLEGGASTQDDLRPVVEAQVERVGVDEVGRRLREALSKMNQAPILTIHGFCQRLLQDHVLSFGVDFDFEIAEDAESIFQDLAIDFWTSELHQSPPWFLDLLRKRGITPTHLARLANVAARPHLDLLGPVPVALDPTLLELGRARKREAAAIWRQRRDEITSILLEDGGLNRSQYRVASIEETWLPGLEAFFGSDSLQPPRWFEKLAQRQIVVKKGYHIPEHPFFAACERLVEALTESSAAFESALFSFQRRFIEAVRTEGVRRCREQGILTYDDLLTSVYRTLDDAIAERIREQYPVALIDEFQDTDSVQYGVFKSIYGAHAAVYVGDPKQAIYAFRGADVFSYLHAASDIGERRIELKVNRRSDPALLSAVQALFSSRPAPFVLDGIDFPSATAHHERRSTLTPAMEIVMLDGDTARSRPIEETVPAIVANEIGLLLRSDARIEGRSVAPKDVAVLCRTNRQALRVAEALRSLDIPASLDGDSSVLGTEIADDLEAVLEGALNPGDSALIRRALLTPLLGVTPLALATMEDDAWSDWVAHFRDWNETWQREGVVRFLEELLRTTDAETRIARLPTARRKLTDLLHVEELLLRGEREHRRDPVALMLWFRRLRRGSPRDTAVADEDLQQRPDAEADTVRVTTIHKSKGLEYGVVYCPFPWRDAKLSAFDKQVVRFHDPSDRYRLKVDLGSTGQERHLEICEREALSEALRLLYVGVTRAKHRCTLLWGLAPHWRSSALSYLLHGESLPNRMDDGDVRRDLDRLCASSGGSIGWRTPFGETATRKARSGSPPALHAKQALRSFAQGNRVASFTSLTGHPEKTVAGGREGETPQLEGLFADLPGGARTGLLLHSLLERIELTRLDGDEASERVRRELEDYGYDPALGPSVLEDLRIVATTPLLDTPGAPRLASIPRERQLRELEFTLHVAKLDFGELAEILRELGGPEGASDYPDRLAAESPRALQRFVRGFIDLVFQWEGRWFVADYKSNALTTYDPGSLAEAAASAHYFLQIQLYAAATHRYLKQRLQGYDPATDWGGAMLLFLRGMRGPEAPGTSVYFTDQSPELLRRVENWLGGGL